MPDEDANSSTAFHLETTDEIWGAFHQKIKLLGGKNWTAENIRTAFEKGSAYQETTGKFKNASEELPVVARNQLDNGESQNLWYEELVPHESVFGFMVQIPIDLSDGENLNFNCDFTEHLNNKVIQIGANATVGYGYCLLTLLNPPARQWNV